MIYKYHLKALIEQTLKEIDMYSKDAVNLILGTCAQESGMGKYLKQLGNGPALGIFQMEPATYIDHWKNFIDSELRDKIYKACKVYSCGPNDMVYNLKFAIIMARIHYRRVKESLPVTLEGYAYYWKKYYNTYLGAGTEEEFIKNYKKYVI